MEKILSNKKVGVFIRVLQQRWVIAFVSGKSMQEIFQVEGIRTILRFGFRAKERCKGVKRMEKSFRCSKRQRGR
jgi:hypothetical protein